MRAAGIRHRFSPELLLVIASGSVFAVSCASADPTAALTYVLRGLTANTTYYFGVAAETAFGNSTLAAASLPGHTLAASPPSAPISLSQSMRTVDSITVNWSLAGLQDDGGIPTLTARVFYEVAAVVTTVAEPGEYTYL